MLSEQSIIAEEEANILRVSDLRTDGPMDKVNFRNELFFHMTNGML